MTITPIDIRPGMKVRFYSTLQGIDGNGFYPALYSSRECEVIGNRTENETGEAMWDVRFADGAVLHVWEAEINDYMYATAQWHGPFAVERRESDQPQDFRINTTLERTLEER